MDHGRVKVAFDKQGESVHFDDKNKQKDESITVGVRVGDGDVSFKTINDEYQTSANNQAKPTSRPMTNFQIRLTSGVQVNYHNSYNVNSVLHWY